MKAVLRRNLRVIYQKYCTIAKFILASLLKRKRISIFHSKMIELNQYGILPVGIHEMSLEEIERLFGNSKSDRRLQLFEKLKDYVERLRVLQIGVALIIDGSFVMSCVDTPADIDIVLVMPEEWEKTIEEIPPEHYNLLSSMKVEEDFGFNLFVVSEYSPEHHGWVRFFSNIKGDWHFSFDIPGDVLKGLVRVTL